MNEPAPFNLAEDGWFNIAAPGEWPHKPTGLVQVLDDEAIAAIIDAFVKFKAEPNWPGVLIDFDHQSLDMDKPTVAAGWIVDLAKRDNGLWAQVRWSDIGRKSIEGGRYRFISPVWKSSDCAKLDGDRIRPLKLMNCAVTNDPNIKGLFPLSNTAGAAIEFSPPPMPIRPEPTPAPLLAPSEPPPTRIGMDAALFNRALYSRSPLAIGNRAPLSRRQEIAIILKSKGRPGGQVLINPAKNDSGSNPAPKNPAGKSEIAAGGTIANKYWGKDHPYGVTRGSGWAYAHKKKAPDLTPEQQYFLDEAKNRAKKIPPQNKISTPETDRINDSLAKLRATFGRNKNGSRADKLQRSYDYHVSRGNYRMAAKIAKQMNALYSSAIPTTPQHVSAPETSIQPNEKSDAARWKALGFGQDESGEWKSEWQLKREGYSLQADGNWKKVPAAPLNTAEINPALETYTPTLGKSNYELRYPNRARHGGILKNYASGRNYDDEQRKAIFAWYAGGARSTGRDSAGRISNLQSQIDELEKSRPTQPDDPTDYSLIDVAEVKRQAMAEGVNSGEVISRIADAKATNAERKSKWAALKRNIRKQNKNKSARERALARYLDKVQSAYADEMKDWAKANAKIDGKISDLRAKIADEEVRGGEATVKAALKDADKAQGELKSIERDRQREAVQNQIAADKKAAREQAEAERKKRNPDPTPAELEQRELQKKLKAERIYAEANKLAQKLVANGRMESARANFPRMDWTAIDDRITAISANIQNPQESAKAISQVVSSYFNAAYPTTV